MAAAAPVDADAAAVPDGLSFCIPPPLLLFSVFCPAPSLWLLPPCFSTACCCYSICLPACLPASLALHRCPPFSAFPLPCSPLCSALDYEIFSSFAAVQSCVTKKKTPYIYSSNTCVFVCVLMTTQVASFRASCMLVCVHMLVHVCDCASLYVCQSCMCTQHMWVVVILN